MALLLFSIAAPAGAQQQGPPAKPQPWWERISFGGDFRARYEGIYQDDRPSRHRQRFRLRLSVTARPHEDLDLGIRLASGDPGDPTSSNQTLGEFFSRKPINIDQAYLAYHPRAVPAVTLGLGKFSYPVTRTQMLWDDDLNWEGLYQQFTFALRKSIGLKFVAIQSPMQEVPAGSDAYMVAGYGQIDWTFAKHRAQLSVADYKFTNVDSVAIAFETRALRTQNTNRVTRNPFGFVTGFASNFNLVDVIAQTVLSTGRPDYPFTILVDLVHNTHAVRDESTGVWTTMTYGRATTPRTYSLSYTFAHIEQDAALSPFAFSDIPATNTRFNGITFSYAPWSRVNLDFIALLTKPLRPTPIRPDTLLSRLEFHLRVAF